MASYGVKGAPIAMSAKEWRLHCQIPHTETSSYLRTSRATFIFDALRRTGWAGGFEPLHLEIRSAELHPASTGSSRRRSGAPFNSRCASSSPAPGLRVLANSDSNMQRFESPRPNRQVSLLTHTESGRARNATKCGVSFHPPSELANTWFSSPPAFAAGFA